MDQAGKIPIWPLSGSETPQRSVDGIQITRHILALKYVKIVRCRKKKYKKHLICE